MSASRSNWTEEVTNKQEDEIIKSFVEVQGLKKWTKIAKAIKLNLGIEGRTGKQCRERWHNHLNPNVTKEDWSPEEEAKIFELQKKLGNKWSEIASFIPGRTDNAVKNCFYSAIRRNMRKFNRKKPESERLKGPIKSLLKKPLARNILMGSNDAQAKDKKKSDVKKKEMKSPKRELKSPKKTTMSPEKKINEATPERRSSRSKSKDEGDFQEPEIVIDKVNTSPSAKGMSISRKVLGRRISDIIYPALSPIAGLGYFNFPMTPGTSTSHLNSSKFNSNPFTFSEDGDTYDSSNYTRSEVETQTEISFSACSTPKYSLPHFSPKSKFKHYITPRTSISK